MTAFDLEASRKLLDEAFAPWVKELGLEPIAFDTSGGRFRMPRNPRLVHIGGVICGQSTAAAADTCAVVTLSALNGRFRVCTTVDLTTHFVRPLKPGDVDIRIDVLSNGKRMAYVKAEMCAAGDTRVAVAATMAFAYLED